MNSSAIPIPFGTLLPLLAALLILPGSQPVFAGEQDKIPAISLPQIMVEPHNVAIGFHADAVVESVNQATVAAQLAGRIVEMKVDAGQVVKKGQLLLRIDAREAAEAAQAARSQLLTAEAHYTRMQNLRGQNFVSQAGLDKARADYDVARASAAQAGVGFGHAAVKAPISGVVAMRHVEQGEMATLGRPLLTIFDPASLRVTASVPQNKLAEMRALQQTRVEFVELGTAVTAAAVQLLPTADEATHTSQARVNLPADIVGVVPGMAARVHFITGHANKMTVPRKAVVKRGEMQAVYIASERGLLLRQVRLGQMYGDDELEVLAGIVAGEQVVLDPVKAAIAIKAAKQNKTPQATGR